MFRQVVLFKKDKFCLDAKPVRDRQGCKRSKQKEFSPRPAGMIVLQAGGTTEVPSTKPPPLIFAEHKRSGRNC